MTSSIFRNTLTPTATLQMVLGWIAVFVLQLVSAQLQAPQSTFTLIGVLIGIIGIIVCSAFGVVTQAEYLARRLGEPFGTLILTVSIVLIEVILIAAVMLGPGEHPTIARDSVMAVSMIILNLVVGLALLVGGFRHAKLYVHRTGVAAYLAVLLPLLSVGLVLPNMLGNDGVYTDQQAITVTAMTIVLYGFFLYQQMTSQRTDFQEPRKPSLLASQDQGAQRVFKPSGVAQLLKAHRGEVIVRSVVLIATVVPIVLLSHDMATYLDTVLDRLGAPVALSGIVIASIVFLPETVTALRAAYSGEMQRVSNLCHGALVSTVGLTIPVVLCIGMLTGQTVILGESPAHMLFLAISLAVTAATFLGGRPTPIHGAAHLMVFVLYILVVFT